MKITLEISENQIAAFQSLATLTNQPWMELLQKAVNKTEYINLEPRELAYEAMLQCTTEEQARETLERAVAITNETYRERLWIAFEEETGAIDHDEAQMRLAAEIILDRPDAFIS